MRADAARRFAVVSAPGKRFAGDEKITDLLLRAAGGDAGALDTALERFAGHGRATGRGHGGRTAARGGGESPSGARTTPPAAGNTSARCCWPNTSRWAFVDAAEVICLRDGAR